MAAISPVATTVYSNPQSSLSLDTLYTQTTSSTVPAVVSASVTEAKVIPMAPVAGECAPTRRANPDGAAVGALVFAAILIAIFTGLMLWYADARMIMSTNETGQVYKNWGKLVGWAIGVGLLFFVVALLARHWRTGAY